MPFLPRLPLLFKLVPLTLLVGVLTSLVLDYFHTRELSALLQQQLLVQLDRQARQDRSLFDQHLRSHHQLARYLASREVLIRHVLGAQWNDQKLPVPTIHKRPPSWFPRTSLLRLFAQPRYTLLVDAHQQVREEYWSADKAPPPSLLNPGLLLSKLSHSSGLLTLVDERPYLLSAAPIKGPHQQILGRVILASPLDSEFLYAAEKSGTPDRLVVLIRDGVIVASTSPGVIVPGSAVANLTSRFQFTGKSFFDYGMADLDIQFASAVATEEIHALTHQLLSRASLQRAITVAVLVVVFVMLALWVVRHIRGVTQSILEFSQQTLGTRLPQTKGGDELYALEQQFHLFQREIIASRNATSEAVAARVRASLEADQQRQMVALLRSVTEALRVGVLDSARTPPTPMNSLMEDYISIVDDTGQFSLDPSQNRKLLQTEQPNHGLRAFDIRRCGDDQDRFVLVQDITDTRETARRLELAVEVIDNSNQGIFVSDKAGKAQLINSAFTSITGHTQSDLETTATPVLNSLLRSPALVDTVWRELIAHGRWEGEFTAGRQHRHFWLRIDSVMPSGDQELHYVGIIADITEKQQAQETLERFAAELQKSNEEIRSFAYIVSHDLRSPLINVKGFAGELQALLEQTRDALQSHLDCLPAETMETVCNNLDTEIPEALGFIDSAVNKMDRLISAILTLSRLGRRELHPDELDLNDLLREALSARSFQLDSGKVKVDVETLPTIKADRTSMEQVIGNILDNAINYLDKERPGRIRIWSEHSPRETIVHIRDNGRGIAPHDYDKVFAIFRRGGDASTPGEGMGLAYVQTLLRRHGGRIWFESVPEQSTTFSFAIPTVLPLKPFAELQPND